jgi:hypothetical protein
MPNECVFCGNKPEEKTKEHIIPKWLMDLTFHPNRDTHITFFDLNKGYKDLNIDYHSFQFPACETCNNSYSTLENETKIIVEKLLTDEEVVEEEIDKLLDWFDKVRVGLWLGYRMLTKNSWDVNPRFHINQRIRKHDRLLFIYKTKKQNKGIKPIGVNTPIFYYIPSCFLLTINHLCFLNISSTFLISRRLGLPFTNDLKFDVVNHVNTIGEFEHGLNRIMEPLLRFPFKKPCLEFYQAIYNDECYDASSSVFNVDYVKNAMLNSDEGISKIYFNNHYPDRTRIFNESVSMLLQPEMEQLKMIYDLSITVLNYQNVLAQVGIEMISSENKEKNKDVKLLYKKLIDINKTLLKKTKEKASSEEGLLM